MAVHDIKVNPVSTSVIDCSNLCRQFSKIGRKNRWRYNNVICQLSALPASAAPKSFSATPATKQRYDLIERGRKENNLSTQSKVSFAEVKAVPIKGEIQ
jgi:hypothetical protein